jgi:hypothetical protein
MSQELTNAILKHIYFNLGIWNSKLTSITDKKFLIDRKIEFVDSADRKELAPIWACQTTINNCKFRIACADLGCQHSDFADQEIAIITRLDDCPAYACLLIGDGENISHSFIACQVKDNWMPATIYLTATFLAGMEQLRDLTTAFQKATDVKNLIDDLEKFLLFEENYSIIAEQ